MNKRLKLNSIKLLSVLVLVLLFVQTGFAFTDTDGHRYEEAVDYLSGQGIVGGYSDGSFQPGKTLNRAELLKIVVEAGYGSEHSGYSYSSCYSDVPAGEWFTSYVCFASAKGIVGGYEDGSFKPAQEVNFVEALKIILLGFGMNPEAKETDYYWYQPYVEFAGVEHYIPLDILSFDQSLTRAQASEILTRILKAQNGDLEEYLGSDFDKVSSYLTISYEYDLELAHLRFKGVILEWINDLREENGAEKLSFSTELNELALTHSRYMNEHNELTHYGEGGMDLSARCEAANIECSSENVASHGLPSGQVFFELWKLSPTHKANMINPEYTEIGLGLSGEYTTAIFR